MSATLAPTEVITRKHAQAAQTLRSAGIDLWVTFVQETSSNAERVFSYLSPAHLTWESAILISPDGQCRLICGQMDHADFQASGLFTEVITYVQDFKNPFDEQLKRLRPRSVALNFSLDDPMADGLPHGRFLKLERLLREALPMVEIVSAEAIIGALVSRKAPEELDRIRRAVLHTTELFAEVGAYLQPARTEREIHGFVLERIAARGLVPSFEPLVFCGDRGGGSGHASATDNPLQRGDLVHVDMGMYVEGYASDMQRTWYALKAGEDRAGEEVARGFNTIVQAIDLSRHALVQGAHGVHVDRVARQLITEAGYPDYAHALGHQLGRHVHDGGALLGPAWPRYGAAPFLPLEAGQVFTLEPSLTVPGAGTIGIEEDVVLNEAGATFLAEPQRELWYIR